MKDAPKDAHPEDGQLAKPILLNADHDISGKVDGFTRELYAAANCMAWVTLIERHVPCDCRLAAFRESLHDPGYRLAIESAWWLTANPGAIWALICHQPEAHAAQAPPPAAQAPVPGRPFLLWVELAGLSTSVVA